jgi:chromosomal replication initiator protein
VDSQKKWNKVLDLIKEQISPGNYKTWFSQIRLGDLEETKITLKVPSAFHKGQLVIRYGDILNQALVGVVGHELEIDYQIDSSLSSKQDKSSDEAPFEWGAPVHTPTQNTNLNPKYTMENFVVGLTNNLAYAAAQAVISNPGVSYNPLFIYGQSGVGKTHLMQAIGHELLKKNPSLKLVFVSSERFMNDHVESIQTKKTGEFRNKYRSADALLIDDIQFIAGKDSTQEEFFHTYNELHGKNTQIVLTSDRPPQEMQKLEDRLRSRFQGGLMVDMQTPDFDTRMAILKTKLTERGDSLPEECLREIAEQVESNARELEGKLIQILQMIKLGGQQPTLEVVRAHLGKQPISNQTKLDQKKVLSGILQYFQIKPADLFGPRRQKELVLPRQIAMYILYKECQLPMEKVGEILGGRDHTTVLHGIKKMEQGIVRDRDLQKLLIEVKQQLT